MNMSRRFQGLHLKLLFFLVLIYAYGKLVFKQNITKKGTVSLRLTLQLFALFDVKIVC